jgi:hypothetical protein
MGEEFERLRVPHPETLHDHPGDADGARQPLVEEIEEDLRRRPERSMTRPRSSFASGLKYLSIRVLVPVVMSG